MTLQSTITLYYGIFLQVPRHSAFFRHHPQGLQGRTFGRRFGCQLSWGQTRECPLCLPDGHLTDEQKARLEGQEVLMVDVTLVEDLDWLNGHTSLTHLDHHEGHEEHIARHGGVYTTEACGAKMLADHYGLELNSFVAFLLECADAEDRFIAPFADGTEYRAFCEAFFTKLRFPDIAQAYVAELMEKDEAEFDEWKAALLAEGLPKIEETDAMVEYCLDPANGILSETSVHTLDGEYREGKRGSSDTHIAMMDINLDKTPKDGPYKKMALRNARNRLAYVAAKRFGQIVIISITMPDGAVIASIGSTKEVSAKMGVNAKDVCHMLGGKGGHDDFAGLTLKDAPAQEATA